MSRIIHRRDPQVGEDVRVHMNLNNGLFTVKAREGRDKEKVIAHMMNISLRRARFVVQSGALESLRDRGTRSVVAYAVGKVSPGKVGTDNTDHYRQVHFNPFMDDNFVLSNGREVHEAELVHFMLDDERKPVTLAYHDDFRINT